MSRYGSLVNNWYSPLVCSSPRSQLLRLKILDGPSMCQKELSKSLVVLGRCYCQSTIGESAGQELTKAGGVTKGGMCHGPQTLRGDKFGEEKGIKEKFSNKNLAQNQFFMIILYKFLHLPLARSFNLI